MASFWDVPPPPAAQLMRLALCFAVATAAAGAALPLPSYLTKCPSKERAALSACALENAGRMLKKVAYDGDRKYGIPVVLPTKVDHIEMHNNGLNIDLRDVTFGEEDGARATEIRAMDVDVQSTPHRLSFTYFQPKAYLKGKYEVTGRILVLPVHGEGDCVVTLEKPIANYSVEFTLENKNGQDFVKLQNPQIDYSMERVIFRFDNLYNGDETLSRATHAFINENWRDVFEETREGPEAAAKATITRALQGFFNRVSMQDAFPQ